jgi:futalosine hydrolase
MSSFRTLLPVHAAAAEGDALRDLGAVALGVGKTASAVALQSLLLERRPAGVLLFGVAGAYPERHGGRAGVGIGDLFVVARDGFGDEGVATEEGFRSLDELSLPAVGPFRLDPALAAAAAQRLGAPLARATTVSTCSGNESLSRERRRQVEAELETMEGAAIAHVCALHRTPLLHVRAVSNFTGDRARGAWDLGLAVVAVQRAVRALLATD